MKIKRAIFLGGYCLIFAFWGIMSVDGQSKAVNIPAEWQTTAEKTNYAKTSTYDEAVAYSKKLAGASSGM